MTETTQRRHFFDPSKSGALSLPTSLTGVEAGGLLKHGPTSYARAATRHTFDIGIDLDGCCYDFVNALRMFIHVTTGRPLHTMPEPTTWNFFETDWGITLQEFLDFHHAGVNAGYIFRFGKPLPGVVSGMRALLDAGHRLHIITARDGMGLPGAAEALTRNYLAEHGIAHTSLTLSHDKNVRNTDVFLDDSPANYVALHAAGRDVFLRDHAYNTHIDTPPGRRVPSFTHFVHGVMTLAMAA